MRYTLLAGALITVVVVAVLICPDSLSGVVDVELVLLMSVHSTTQSVATAAPLTTVTDSLLAVRFTEVA